jgi:hypothetical protein
MCFGLDDVIPNRLENVFGLGLCPSPDNSYRGRLLVVFLVEVTHQPTFIQDFSSKLIPARTAQGLNGSHDWFSFLFLAFFICYPSFFYNIDV